MTPKPLPHLLSVLVVASAFHTTAAAAQSGTSGGTQPTQAEQPAPAEATTAPELVNSVEVDRATRTHHPPLLRDAGVEGTVLVRLRVAADGTVERGSIIVAYASHELFEVSARRVAARMQFRPAQRGGVPVPAEITVPLKFELRP